MSCYSWPYSFEIRSEPRELGVFCFVCFVLARLAAKNHPSDLPVSALGPMKPHPDFDLGAEI